MAQNPPKPDRDALIEREWRHVQKWLPRAVPPALYDYALDELLLKIIEIVDEFLAGKVDNLRKAVNGSVRYAIYDARAESETIKTPRGKSALRVGELPEEGPIAQECETDDPAPWLPHCRDDLDAEIMEALSNDYECAEIAVQCNLSVKEVAERAKAVMRAMAPLKSDAPAKLISMLDMFTLSLFSARKPDGSWRRITHEEMAEFAGVHRNTVGNQLRPPKGLTLEGAKACIPEIQRRIWPW